MVIIRFPGVFRPQHDSRLLLESLGDEQVHAGTRILDLCAGTGVVSVWATRSGARSVTAVDVSRRALVSTWLNAGFAGTVCGLFAVIWCHEYVTGGST